MARRSNTYFDDFKAMGKFSVQAAEFLHEALANYKTEDLSAKLKAMHAIEHEADMYKHDIMKRQVKEFVTPIDREDIISLANRLDDLTDTIEEVLVLTYMYNVQEMRDDVGLFTTQIVKICQFLEVALAEFANFQKSTTLMQAIIDVNSLEGKGDDLYTNAVRRLYTTETDPILISTWRQIYDRLEECFDVCENVADAMEIISMKNS